MTVTAAKHVKIKLFYYSVEFESTLSKGKITPKFSTDPSDRTWLVVLYTWIRYKKLQDKDSKKGFFHIFKSIL